jgi:REP element-mobilizing transposase RayT
MPNHVHLLLRPFAGNSLSSTMKRIKGVSARRSNSPLGRREADHFLNAVQYIIEDAVMARLCKAPDEWPFGCASPQAASADKSVRVPTNA